MQELKKHGKNNFDVKFLVMDPGYNQLNREKIEENAKLLDVPVRIFETNIFDHVTNLTEGSSCYLCARMRRGNLYAFAKEMGCNKIALGHHFNDVIETTLLSMLYNGKFKTMMPKLKSLNFAGMELIRPLYKVKEHDILNWVKHNELSFINCACKLTEACALNPEDETISKRREMKNLIKQLKTINPEFDRNIFTSLYGVNLTTVLSYEKDGKTISFLDNYEESSTDKE
jgi:tRNA(Ile)-lysidine synthase TilS/MesJ